MHLLEHAERIWPEPCWERDERNLDSIRARVGEFHVQISQIFRTCGAHIEYYNTYDDRYVTLFEFFDPQVDAVLRITRGVFAEICNASAKLIGMHVEHRSGVQMPRGVRPPLRDITVQVEDYIKAQDLDEEEVTMHGLAHRIQILAAEIEKKTSRIVYPEKPAKEGEELTEPIRILDLSVQERHELGAALHLGVLEVISAAFLVENLTKPWRKHFD